MFKIQFTKKIAAFLSSLREHFPAKTNHWKIFERKHKAVYKWRNI